MNNATLPTADVATHVKIVAIVVAAAIVAGLVATTAQTRPEFEAPLQTTGHAVAPGN
jgi:hypothetical protein